MTIRKMFETYFNNDGFQNPLHNFCNKQFVSFEEEKIIVKVFDRICKHFDIVKEIQQIEDGTVRASNIMLHAIHCELFSNLISIYNCAERLFILHIKSDSAISEVDYWNDKYSLPNTDKLFLAKPDLDLLLKCNNSTLDPKLVLKVHKDTKMGMTFNCYDYSLNSIITDAESIRTKYIAIQFVIVLFNYLVTMDKFFGMDEKIQNNNTKIYDVYDMKSFIKIGEEFLGSQF